MYEYIVQQQLPQNVTLRGDTTERFIISEPSNLSIEAFEQHKIGELADF